MAEQAKRRDSSGKWVKGVSGNPAGSRKTKAPQVREDGYVNLVTRLGTGRDLRTHGRHVTDPVSDEYALELWRGDDIAARIIEEIVEDALRPGYELKIGDGKDGDKERQERTIGKMQDLESAEKVGTAGKYERAFGGGAVLLGVPDNEDLGKPIDEESRRGVRFLTEFEPRELTPRYWYSDPKHPKFGKVEIYNLVAHAQGMGRAGSPTAVHQPIHESRLLIFPGIKVSRHQQSLRHGWGDSVLTRVHHVVRDFGQSWESVSAILQNFSQAILKIHDLARVLSMGAEGEKAATRKLEMIDMARSLQRMIPIDSQDEFQWSTMTLSGIPEILDRIAYRTTAAAQMPVTKLLGRAPAGMNATGESDMRQWYDRVDAYREQKIRPALERIAKFVMQEDGGEPDSWAIEFPSLWQPSDKERAETHLTQAQADAIYIDRGASVLDVLRSRFGGDEYTLNTQLDMEALELIERGFDGE